MPGATNHPATGEPITLADGEELQRIAWPGAPVLVITTRNAEGEPIYRLARAGCRTWNPLGSMKVAPWPEPAG